MGEALPEPGLPTAIALAESGQFADAVSELVNNGDRADPRVDRELVAYRYRARRALMRAQSAGSWPDEVEDLFSDVVGVPEIEAADLDATALRSAVMHHGSLIVRGLVDSVVAQGLCHDIDRAVTEAQKPAGQKRDARWFLPFSPPGQELLHNPMVRPMMAKVGTVYVADSPTAMQNFVEVIDAAGLRTLMTDLFGEPPLISVVKTAMRRVPPGTPGGWHQDLYAFGPECRTMNLWLTTSDCGEAAPGLDLIPTRIARSLHVTTDFVPIEPETLAVEQEKSGVERPTFAAGDALFFDQWLVHSTSVEGAFTHDRYGYECWFFAPSTCPDRWAPLAL